jgi:periplasmic glucans biosynthesis protein
MTHEPTPSMTDAPTPSTTPHFAFNRRQALSLALAAAAAGPALGGRAEAQTEGQTEGQRATTPENLVEAARARAAAPYRPERPPMQPPFDRLTYDSWRGIRPRPGGAGRLPMGGGWAAELLPPGWLFPDPVAVELPDNNGPVPFDAGLFTYDPRYHPDPPTGPMAGMGFAGLRLMAPINLPGQLDEVLVLLGASYFRALAHGAAWGLSARGLALGTGGAAPEEFPVTRRIAVFGTAPGQLHMGALIESPSACAALIVTLTHGTAADPLTVMDCALHLFPRVTLTEAGIAPLTSMFLRNALGPARIDDFRPAVHDSDVLLMDTGAGERLWRPLSNPLRPHLSAFADPNPRRFGLIQTPVEFERFRDAEADYHRRPSAWVEPLGDWGAGAVMLLELPAQDEYGDNIGAFWRPAEPLVAGRAHRFDYRLTWAPAGPAAVPPGAHAAPWVPLRAGSGIDPIHRDGRLYVIDFAPTGAPAAPAEALVPDITAPEGVRVLGAVVYPLGPEPGHLRASFTLVPSPGLDRAEVRLLLRRRADSGPESPVWLHRWDRAPGGGA